LRIASDPTEVKTKPESGENCGSDDVMLTLVSSTLPGTAPGFTW
jgi:hypothetical protein